MLQDVTVTVGSVNEENMGAVDTDGVADAAGEFGQRNGQIGRAHQFLCGAVR